MVKLISSLNFFPCILVLFCILVSSSTVIDDHHQNQQVYIVYMGGIPSQQDYIAMSHHINILQEITGESSIENRLVRSYKRSFNGFAARLTESEREKLANMEGIVSVIRNKKLKLQTTSSWDFMGLKEGNKTKRNLTVESDTIIGVIDTGISPESDSFSDVGFGPPPKKWKGVCSGGANFTCNNKVIGARDYTNTNANANAKDFLGHGTHTSSTAAGNAVTSTSFFGIANGTARGGVPASRIAVYKVCGGAKDDDGCSTDGLLSAFDDAIADGVDIISISIGGDYSSAFDDDVIALGAFHGMVKGVLTVNSAGNNGGEEGAVASVAPWMLSVAASSTDRGLITKVVLGDGKILNGKSVNAYDLKGQKYPIVYGKSALSSNCGVEYAEECEAGCLDETLVKGKIVVCNSTDSTEPQSKGAVAAIVRNPELDVAQVTSFPLSALSDVDFDSLLSYIKSTKSPEAAVLKTEAIFNQTAPKMASFSSRGPNLIAKDILKPDITAPGVEILAAYSPEASPSETQIDTRRVKYSVISGTSMSCPHVAGVAAYVKTFNPQWSPSMIQSAIMTTAWPMNASKTGIPSSEFSYGAGHVNPISASNPGLVYSLTKADHIGFLCGLNYTTSKVQLISGEKVTCNDKTKILPRNLNYPSMAAKLSATNSSFSVSFDRTVTNVGNPNSTYVAKIVPGHGSELRVKVTPSVLSFVLVNEKQSFMVTVTGADLGPKSVASANLIWSDGVHSVRSPIVVYS